MSISVHARPRKTSRFLALRKKLITAKKLSSINRQEDLKRNQIKAMGKLPSPPVIEGTLKEPIYAMSFGILVSMWSINIMSLLTPHYFAYVVSTVFAFECLLWFLDKPRQDYEVYKPPTESKRQEKGDANPKGETSTGEEGTTSPKKTQLRLRTAGESGEAKAEKGGKESRFRFRQKKNTDSPQSPSPQ